MPEPTRVPEGLPVTRGSEARDVDDRELDTVSANEDRTILAAALGGPSPAGSESRRLGRYEVVGRLGAGGMGEVLAVRDADLGRDIAAKVVRGHATDALLAKFYREARITGALEHPSIVPVHELSRSPDGRVFFTMKRIDGAELSAVLHDAPLSELLGTFVKVCEAMGYAHSQGVIHRDLKPANIMVGEHGCVYVCDWGLARRVDGTPEAAEAAARLNVDSGAAHTLDGTVMGTPAYMSPEQAEGRIEILDGQSDVYSLGAILYEVLARVPPYRGRDGLKVIAAVVAGPPPSPSSIAPAGREIPWELEAICAKAMARDRDQRYASAAALASDIEAFRAGRSVGAARYGVLEAVRKRLAQHPVLVRSTAAVVLALAMHLGYGALRHAGTVREAWDAVARSGYPALVAAAQALPLDPDPARRPLPTASERSQWLQLAFALQGASQALSEVLALAPDHGPSRRAHGEVLLALGRVAEAGHDDALAVQAYRLAAQMDTDRDAALTLATRAADAREARGRAQVERVEARLIQARNGELTSEWAYRDAVAELASFRDRATVELLARVVEGTAALLEGVTRAAYAEAVEPNAAERAAGERRIEGVVDAVDMWIAGRGAGVSAAASEAIFAAAGRIARRVEPRTPRTPALVGFEAGGRVLARRQGEALAAGRADRARELALACEALGLLGDGAAIDALERVIRADCDEGRGVIPGIALVRLVPRSARARTRLLSTVGLGENGDAARFRTDGEYWRVVGRELVATRSALPTPADSTPPGSWLERALRLEEEGDLAPARAAADRAVDQDRGDVAALRVRGRLRGRTGDLAGALSDFDRAIELAPAHAETWSNRGEARRELGDLEGARGDHDRAIELDPGTATWWRQRGRLRTEQGELDGALADCARAVELAPRDGLARRFRGVARFKLGNWAGAIADFDRVLELDPRDAIAHMHRGVARSRVGDLAAALADCTRSIELDSRDARAYGNRASVRLLGKDLVAAESDCDRAIELDPLYLDAWLNRGSARRALGRVHQAIGDYDRAVEIDPRSFAAHFGRARCLVELGELALAIAGFDRALELDPASSAGYRERGNAHGRAGAAQAAIADFGRAIELDPGNADAYGDRGSVRQMMGQLPEALADLTRAIELDPAASHTCRNRAVVRRGLGDVVGALADLARAIELHPRFALAYSDRGQLCADRRDFAAAIEDYDRALDIEPSQPLVLNNRGVAKHESGDFEGAIADARGAIAQAPTLWQAHALLGTSLARAGRSAEANAAFDGAARVAPDEPTRAHVEALRNTFLSER